MVEFINQILCCDCVAGMKKLPDGSISFTLTSPPYDGLRKYGGHTFDFEAVAKELYRITMSGGTVVWIVQDQVVNGGETGTSFEQVLYFKSIGFRLHSTMLMVINCGKLPHRTRYVPLHHYAFVLSKERPRYVNLIRDRHNLTKAKRREWYARRENGEVVSGRQSPRDTPPVSEGGNVWHYNVGYNQTTKDKDAFTHPALMPEEMAEDHIVSWSRPGDLVFDPFCGAGTTCKMALLNNRRYLGMEIHKPYQELAIRRVDDARAEHRQRLDAYFQIEYSSPKDKDAALFNRWESQH
jgi:site-specific DNA-methyltransferase (adenine-specific)